jgi:hypothetical protein
MAEARLLYAFKEKRAGIAVQSPERADIQGGSGWKGTSTENSQGWIDPHCPAMHFF